MRLTEPEWLSRKDVSNGNWVVEGCEPKRGIPGTNIIDKQMRVPVGENETERCIRAHELMHAKVSPGQEWDKWLNRKIASERALTVCEELRVNLLCQRAGFDMATHLTDGGETADGERIAITGTWADAVYNAIAVAGTASQKKYLTGIRRHNRIWGKALLTICKRAVKEMQGSRNLGDTSVHEKTGLAPYGFFHTEQLAEWVDRIAKADAPDAPKKEDAKKNSKSSLKSSSQNETEASDEESPKSTDDEENEFLQRLKKIPTNDGSIPYWGGLKIERLPMPKQTRGSIGKKRTASNIGKSPRRLHRYMTDPEKRIFDKTSHGMGGVVVIDASGSMDLKHEEVRMMVEASPGATVLAYSDDSYTDTPNAWVLADKGRMVEAMPDGIGKGNGVDFPALEWAVKNRQRSSSPIIWVTDGGVCGPNQGFSEVLALQCVEYCRKHRIIVLPTVDYAIAELKKMQRGVKGSTQWPWALRRAYKSQTGQVLA